jgi:hypothetical protein
MDLAAEHASENGGNIQQWEYAGGNNQKFQFTHLGDGTYKISVVESGKVVDVDGISKNEGANVFQWDYFGTFNQQFVMQSTGDGYYKIIPKHSGKVVEVENASLDNGANVRQWGNNNQTCGQWKLIIPTARIATVQKTAISAENRLTLYPNPATETIYVSSRELAGASVSVVNVAGNRVINTVITANSIDVSKLQPGVYIITINKGGKTIVKKFVKN